MVVAYVSALASLIQRAQDLATGVSSAGRGSVGGRATEAFGDPSAERRIGSGVSGDKPANEPIGPPRRRATTIDGIWKLTLEATRFGSDRDSPARSRRRPRRSRILPAGWQAMRRRPRRGSISWLASSPSYQPESRSRPTARTSSPTSRVRLARRGRSRLDRRWRCAAAALREQAVLRWHPRQHRVHRREGPQARARPARHVRRPAGHGPGQPGHLPALRLLHRPAGHRVPRRTRAVRHAQRRAHGRDHPRGARLPVGCAELRHRRPRSTRGGGPPRPPRAEHRGHQGRPVPDHRRHRAARRRRRRRRARTRAPHASTMRCAAAATHRTSRSAAACTATSSSTTRCPTRTREPTHLRVGRRPARPHPDDPDLLREVRPPGPAARAAVRDHVPRPSRASGQLAGRGVLRPEGLQRASTAAIRGCSPSTSARASPRSNGPAGSR